MSLATLRKSLLTNVPNIPRLGINIAAAADRKAASGIIEFKGREYSVAMFYVNHTECGKRIRALFPRAEYNRFRRDEDRAYGKPTLVFCPTCRAMAGKHVRRQLLTQGRLHCFHNPDGNYDRNFVAANYIFPRGVGYDLEGEITSIDQEWVRRVDDDGVEVEVPDPDGIWVARET